MKKLFLLLILTNSILYASFLNYHLDEARVLYKNNQFQNVINYLDEYSDEFPDYPQLNFILGQTYFQLKKYQTSIIYFERILILDEENTLARLELAQSYMMANLDNDAIFHYNFVLKSKIPQNVRLNIESKIKHIKNKNKKHHINGFISFGLTQDSNINNTTDISSFDTINYTDLQITDKQYSDIYSTLILNINHKYNTTDTSLIQNKLLYLREDFNKDDQRQNNTNSTGISREKERALELMLYSFEYYKNFNDKDISFSIDLANVKLANTDYLNIAGINSSYSKQYFRNTKSKITAKYFQKMHSQIADENLDSDNYQISLETQLNTLSYGKSILSYSILDEQLKKQSPNTSNKLSNIVNLLNTYKINPKLELLSSLNYSKTNYKSVDSSFNIKRSDNLSTFKIGLSYNFNSSLNITSNISYKKNNSNIDIYSYDKNIINLFITKAF